MTNLFCANQYITWSSLSSIRALFTHSSEVSASGSVVTAGTDDIIASQYLSRGDTFPNLAWIAVKKETLNDKQ